MISLESGFKPNNEVKTHDLPIHMYKFQSFPLNRLFISSYACTETPAHKDRLHFFPVCFSYSNFILHTLLGVKDTQDEDTEEK